MTVSLEGSAHADTTDVRGVASIVSITTGRYVVRVAGPPGFDTVRLVVEVPAAGTLTIPPAAPATRAYWRGRDGAYEHRSGDDARPDS